MKGVRNQTGLWICSSVVQSTFLPERSLFHWGLRNNLLKRWKRIVSSPSLSLDASFSKNKSLNAARVSTALGERDAAAVVARSGFQASPFPVKEMLFSQCWTKYKKRLSVLANKHPDISWQLVPVWIGFRSSKYFPSILSQSPSFQHFGSRSSISWILETVCFRQSPTGALKDAVLWRWWQTSPLCSALSITFSPTDCQRYCLTIKTGPCWTW